jgi:hypothetical protein
MFSKVREIDTGKLLFQILPLLKMRLRKDNRGSIALEISNHHNRVESILTQLRYRTIRAQ